MTNGDRVRQMSNEELAEILKDVRPCCLYCIEKYNTDNNHALRKPVRFQKDRARDRCFPGPWWRSSGKRPSPYEQRC